MSKFCSVIRDLFPLPIGILIREYWGKGADLSILDDPGIFKEQDTHKRLLLFMQNLSREVKNGNFEYGLSVTNYVIQEGILSNLPGKNPFESTLIRGLAFSLKSEDPGLATNFVNLLQILRNEEDKGISTWQKKLLQPMLFRCSRDRCKEMLTCLLLNHDINSFETVLKLFALYYSSIEVTSVIGEMSRAVAEAPSPFLDICVKLLIMKGFTLTCIFSDLMDTNASEEKTRKLELLSHLPEYDNLLASPETKRHVLQTNDVLLAKKMIDFTTMSEEEKDECIILACAHQGGEMLNCVLGETKREGLVTFSWTRSMHSWRLFHDPACKELLSHLDRKELITRLFQEVIFPHSELNPRALEVALELLKHETWPVQFPFKYEKEIAQITSRAFEKNLSQALCILKNHGYVRREHAWEYVKKNLSALRARKPYCNRDLCLFFLIEKFSLHPDILQLNENYDIPRVLSQLDEWLADDDDSDTSSEDSE